MTVLDDVVSALTNAGIGQITSDRDDWFMYCGYLPESPDRAISIFEAAGPAPEETMAIEYPSIQIRVRGARGGDDYQTVRAKMRAIFDLLHGGDAGLGADYVYFYAAHSGALSLGRDENLRNHMATNFRVMRARE